MVSKGVRTFFSRQFYNTIINFNSGCHCNGGCDQCLILNANLSNIETIISIVVVTSIVGVISIVVATSVRF